MVQRPANRAVGTAFVDYEPLLQPGETAYRPNRIRLISCKPAPVKNNQPPHHICSLPLPRPTYTYSRDGTV